MMQESTVQQSTQKRHLASRTPGVTRTWGASWSHETNGIYGDSWSHVATEPHGATGPPWSHWIPWSQRIPWSHWVHWYDSVQWNTDFRDTLWLNSTSRLDGNNSSKVTTSSNRPRGPMSQRYTMTDFQALNGTTEFDEIVRRYPLNSMGLNG